MNIQSVSRPSGVMTNIIRLPERTLLVVTPAYTGDLNNSMTEDGPNSPSAPVATTIMLKLPPFWPTDHEVRFAQVLAQFTTRGILIIRRRSTMLLALSAGICHDLLLTIHYENAIN